MTAMKKLAINIKKYRRLRGWTQQKLAERIFVTAQAISKWETGVAVPDVENLWNLAEALSIPVDRLLGRYEEEEGAFYIAVDGGGSKTEFLLFRGDGQILLRLALGGSNPNVVGFENALALLRQGMDSLLSVRRRVSGVFLGISGCAAGNNRARMQEELEHYYPQLRLEVGSDIWNVVCSAKEHQKCIAAICGTGSVVYGCDGEQLKRLGGWGYLFDGAGSGYDIGRDVLQECLKKGDGLSGLSLLTELAEKQLGGAAWEKLNWLYAGGKEQIAAFAPVAFAALEQGDPIAEDILRRNFRRLALLINTAYERYDCGRRVILSGGLAARQTALRRFLEPDLKPGILLVFPELPPIYGACVRALERFDGEIPADFEEKIKKGLAT